MFNKPFPSLSPPEIATLARHSAALHIALQDCADVICPAVLGHDERSINYTLVKCDEPMLARLQNMTSTPEDMTRAGRILKHIHAAPGALLHADYVPHNLFHDGSLLVLIDPHPPERLGYDEKRLYGPPEREVMGFLFVLLSDAGLKRAILHWQYYISLMQGFVSGYGKDWFRQRSLLRPLWKEARDSYTHKRAAGCGFLHSVGHCVLGCILTLGMLRLSL